MIIDCLTTIKTEMGDRKLMDTDFKKFGKNIRIYPQCKLINPHLIEIGDDSVIDDFTFIYAGEGCKIGHNTHIASFVSIIGGGEISIGSHVGISQGVRFATGTHDYKLGGYLSAASPIEKQAVRRGKIVIEDNVLILSNTVVIPDVTIGEGAVIGANSVINRDIEPWSVNVGIPCRKIGMRQKDGEFRKMSVGIFITARMGSSRLKYKHMKKIRDKYCIDYVIETAKKVPNVDCIVLCTTELEDDLQLVEIAKKHKILWFQGDEHDVMNRHYEAAKHFNVDYIVNLDGDDIFQSIEHLEEVVRNARMQRYDSIYSDYNSFPLGCGVVAYSIDALKQILERSRETGWGEYFRNADLFRVKMIKAKPEYRVKMRCTMDYPEDYEFFKAVIEGIDKDDFTFDDVIDYVNEHPEVIEININSTEKYFENYNQKKQELLKK